MSDPSVEKPASYSSAKNRPRRVQSKKKKYGAACYCECDGREVDDCCAAKLVGDDNHQSQRGCVNSIEKCSGSWRAANTRNERTTRRHENKSGFLFGAYALVDGAFSIVAGIKSYGEQKRWWLLLIGGCLSVAAGVFAFMIPAMTALILLTLIASWAIVTGAFQIAAAIQLRKHITGEWLLALSGVLSVLFGVMLLYNPVGGALAVVWLIGAYAVFFGLLLLVFGIKLRGLVHSADNMVPHGI